MRIDFKDSNLTKGILVVAFAAFCASPALAQSYDTSGIMSTNRDMGYISPNLGQANNSLGAKGSVNRGSYNTGEAPSDYEQFDKRQTSFSTKQLYNRDAMLNSPLHPLGLELPLTSTGGLAPVFGMGSQNLSQPVFTSRMDQAITTVGNNGHVSIIPSTGQVVGRVGGARGGFTMGADGITGGSIGGQGVGAIFNSNGASVGGNVPGLGTFGNSGF